MIYELVSCTTGEIVRTFNEKESEEMELFLITHSVKFSEKTEKELNEKIEKLKRELELVK